MEIDFVPFLQAIEEQAEMKRQKHHIRAGFVESDSEKEARIKKERDKGIIDVESLKLPTHIIDAYNKSSDLPF